MKMRAFLILLIVSLTTVSAQEYEIKKIRQNLENFNYQKVVNLSEELLEAEVELTDSQRIDIFTMKGVAHYSEGETEKARKSFLEILKIDDSHDLDPVEISPKIINFFNEIKQDYSAVNQEETPINENMGEDLTKEQTYQNIINKKNKVYQHSLLRSFAAPGWGHLYLSGSSKGWILTTASTAALGSMLYFIYDANQKETDYLNETNKTLIQEKYDEYNTSYKIRNGLIFTYAAIWLYSQIDLLFFSDDQINQKIQTNFGYFPFKSDQFFLSFRIAI